MKGDNQYVLTNSTMLPSDEPNGQRLWLLFPFAAASIGRTYLDIAQDPKTKVLSAKETVWRGQTAFEVQLEIAAVVSGKEARGRGIWYFSPAAGWVCVGERSSGGASKRHYEFVYKYDTSGEWAVPTRQELWEVDDGDPQANKLRRAIDIVEFAPAEEWDEANFRLSAFGLPEPVGVVWPSRTPAALWFILAAVGFAVVAVAVRWLLRSRTKAEST